MIVYFCKFCHRENNARLKAKTRLALAEKHGTQIVVMCRHCRREDSIHATKLSKKLDRWFVLLVVLGSAAVSVGLMIYFYQTLIHTSSKMQIISIALVAAIFPLTVASVMMYEAEMRVRYFNAGGIGEKISAEVENGKSKKK